MSGATQDRYFIGVDPCGEEGDYNAIVFKSLDNGIIEIIKSNGKLESGTRRK